MRRVIGLCLAAMPLPPAHALEVRVAPSDSLIVNPANPSRGYADVILHSVGIMTDVGERVVVDQLRVEFVEKGNVVLTEIVPANLLVRQTAELASTPVSGFVAAQLLHPKGLAGFFGDSVTLAKSPSLDARQALVSTRRYFAIRPEVDAVRIVVEAHDSTGKAIKSERVVPIVRHESSIEYAPPIKGTWLMQAIPTLQSHHRFNPPSEYAVDFFKVDAEGRLYKGDNLIAENSFGFGAEVSAAADGVVVMVNDGDTQDRAAFTRRPDESPQAAGERIGRYNMERYAKDFARASGGNMVVLEHRKDGRVEYSSYGHLQRGVSVKVGDTVKQGQLIGRVGDTGDSAAVHLHFQVNAGPDPFTTKSLPVRFARLRNAGGNSELGRFVIAE